jgi:hypothetical protein
VNIAPPTQGPHDFFGPNSEILPLIDSSLHELFSSIGAAGQVGEESLRRGQFVIESRAGIRTQPLTLDETGETLGVTRERVRQIEHRYHELIAHEHTWFNQGLPKIIFDELRRKASIVFREPCALRGGVYGFLSLLSLSGTKINLSTNAVVSVICLAPWEAYVVAQCFHDAIDSLWKANFEDAFVKLKGCIPTSLASAETDPGIEERLYQWLRAAEASYAGLSRRDEISRRALFELGGTQHFSIIARRSAEIEKVQLSPDYTHNVHAALGRCGNYFIRPGGNGMFALRGFAEDTGLDLKDLMERALRETDEWLSAEELLSRMPRGSQYRLSSIVMTAQYFPELFKFSEQFGLIQLKARTEVMVSKSVIAAVEDVLRREKHCTRPVLHAKVENAFQYQIDAVLMSHPGIAAIGASRHLRFVLFDSDVPKKRLSTAEFADLISARTGLLSAPALARYIEKHYGWNPSAGSIGG